MQAVKRSHIGLKRKNNEDNCGIYSELNLLAVADGMGGHMAGEVASKMALDLVEQFLIKNSKRLQLQPKQILEHAVKQANQQMFEHAQGNSHLEGMGTTITLVFITGNKAVAAHIGDSRAYLISDNLITLITSDHSLVNELLKNGGITKEEAKKHPQRNVLTRALGTSLDIEVDFYEFTIKEGDKILLCTDGLSNLVTPDEMLEKICKAKNLDEAADKFIDIALERGGQDNISLVLGVI